MALRQTKKISELPPLSPASLDTTFVVGISGSTTYKISINNLTSSLDTTFATDLVTNALSSSLDTKLSTSSFNSYTASQSTSSLVNRLNAIESVSGSWITESETGSFLTSLSGAISSSTQISDLGFVTGSYTTINSFNSLTQSFNSISQSFTTISGSVGGIDFSTLATTGSNTFIGNQTITGSVGIRANSGSWNFRTDGTLVLPNGTGIYGNGLLQVDTIGGFLLTSYTDQIGGGSQEWYFHSDGILNVPGNIEGADNLLTTSSFNSYTASISTASLVTSISNLNSATSSYLTSLSGAISSSFELTSSFDTRYAASGSVGSSVNTASLATTGSNSFNGNQTITGSLVVSAVAVVNGGITIPTGSVISLTSGSSLFVDISGSITGSLTGSVFGIGDVVAFSASVNNRILSGSAVAGTVSGSSQLTSSFDTRYAISASFVSSSNLSSIRTITSASYAALTPVSGTLYIIIG